jgi:hypothetical protein
MYEKVNPANRARVRVRVLPFFLLVLFCFIVFSFFFFLGGTARKSAIAHFSLSFHLFFALASFFFFFKYFYFLYSIHICFCSSISFLSFFLFFFSELGRVCYHRSCPVRFTWCVLGSSSKIKASATPETKPRPAFPFPHSIWGERRS